MQLPHPFPYSEAVDIIANHWLDLKKFLSSANSEIRPLSHYDGRVIKFTSNYATNGTPPPFKLKKPLHKSALIDIDFIKGQVIEIDLSNFFHSIYTHALDWVVTGNRSHNSPSVGSEVDRAFRLINTNRTDGVCVGPALSNIAGEIILHQIDELLENRCSNGELYFTRHIDDITIHCKKGIDVDDLINEINSHLIHFGLSLNHTKTNISTYQDYYIGHIRQNAQQLLATVPSLTSLIDFRILFAHIQANARDLKKHSLMLYVWKMAKSQITQNETLPKPKAENFLVSSWELCIDSPHLIPHVVISSIAAQQNNEFSLPQSFFDQILQKVMNSRITDSTCWLIYYAHQSNLSVRDVLDKFGFFSVHHQAENSDPWWDPFISLMLLSLHDAEIDKRLSVLYGSEFPPLDDPLVDEGIHCWSPYWPIRYQLYRDGLITLRADSDINYSSLEKEVFNILKAGSFTLIERE